MATERSQHLLVVDDDQEIRDLVSRFLTRHGYRVTTARDGREMRRALADWSIDLIVLDLMLPGTDGLTLCRELRANSTVPVIMLTAMGEEVDRILGLEMGADDYLPKPFNPRELLARIKAVLRRIEPPPRFPDEARSDIVRFKGWELDTAARVLKNVDGTVVDLTAGDVVVGDIEARLLDLLPEQVQGAHPGVTPGAAEAHAHPLVVLAGVEEGGVGVDRVLDLEGDLEGRVHTEALLGGVHLADQPQHGTAEGGFAATAFADDAEGLARPQRKAYPIHRLQPRAAWTGDLKTAGVDREVDGQVFDLQEGGVGHGGPSR